MKTPQIHRLTPDDKPCHCVHAVTAQIQRRREFLKRTADKTIYRPYRDPLTLGERCGLVASYRVDNVPMCKVHAKQVVWKAALAAESSD